MAQAPKIYINSPYTRTAAAGPNMVLLYSVPLLYYTIQFLICPVFSVIFTENTGELATIGSEVPQDPSQTNTESPQRIVRYLTMIRS